MRILHVFDHSLPLQSGYVFRSLGILGAQRGFGWETIHLTTPRYNAGQPEVETVDGWTFHRTPKPAPLFAARPVLREALEMRAVAARLRGLIAAHKPDIVHAHSPVLTGLPALWAGRRAGLPVVYEVRAPWEDAAVDHGTTREGSARYRAVRGLETLVARGADGVVTLCEGMRAEFAGRGIAADKITVVPNAVDAANFTGTAPRDAGLARALGLQDRVVLGFIGSFYRYEGLDLLVAALPAIRQRVPGAALLLVGGGEEAERLQAQVADLGLGEHVRFTGRVPHGEVQRYYGLVDLFVYPRRSMRLTELVTPLKPLEAMAARQLVIASDIGGHRELIRDGVTGFLFAPDDPAALARRVADAVGSGGAGADAMRAAGRRFIETERSWPASAAHYEPLYRALLQRARRPQPA